MNSILTFLIENQISQEAQNNIKNAEDLERKAEELRQSAIDAQTQSNTEQPPATNPAAAMAQQMALSQIINAGIMKTGEGIGSIKDKVVNSGAGQKIGEKIGPSLSGVSDYAKQAGSNISAGAGNLYNQATQSGVGQSIAQHAGTAKSALMANPMLGVGAAGVIGTGLLARRMWKNRRNRW